MKHFITSILCAIIFISVGHATNGLPSQGKEGTSWKKTGSEKLNQQLKKLQKDNNYTDKQMQEMYEKLSKQANFNPKAQKPVSARSNNPDSFSTKRLSKELGKPFVPAKDDPLKKK